MIWCSLTNESLLDQLSSQNHLTAHIREYNNQNLPISASFVNSMEISKQQYEYALNRIEELLPLVTDETAINDPKAIELAIVSDVVEAYEKIHYPIAKPTIGELISLSIEEKGITQKQLAHELGVSPSRISDYISGRAEPTLRIARALCTILGIAPAAMLGT